MAPAALAIRNSGQRFTELVVNALDAQQLKRTDAARLFTSSERKTGVKPAEAVTIRLVCDERGWLRLEAESQGVE